MRKKSWMCVVVLIAYLGIIYLVLAFITWDMNIINWGWLARLFFIGLSILVTIATVELYKEKS